MNRRQQRSTLFPYATLFRSRRAGPRRPEGPACSCAAPKLGWRSRGGRLSVGALPFGSVGELEAALREHAYLADRGLATALHLALALDKPLLLEGEAGVGKTEVAKVLAALLGRQLVRLQCYAGIDA